MPLPPAALVEWLREILPGKTTAELYMAIGCQKHAKRKVIGNICSIANCDEQFIEAPGIRGMVMLVFTLPGFDRVFKIIKDKFAPQKRCLPPTSAPVINWSKSTIVLGGWLTPEFENFVLDKRQIDPALMALLLQEAPEKLPILAIRLSFAICISNDGWCR